MDGAEPNSQMGKDTHLCNVAHRVSAKALEAMTGETERGAERVKPKAWPFRFGEALADLLPLRRAAKASNFIIRTILQKILHTFPDSWITKNIL